MGLRIGTNIAAMSVMRNMRLSQNDTNRAMAQLSSGNKFSTAGSDPAGFAISERLRGQAQGLRASKMNADNAISFIQVAEGGLNEQNNIIIRMRELAIQSASDTVSETERGFLNQEFQQLRSEIDRVAKTTQYGSAKLLMGSGKSFSFQVGAYDGPENQINYSLEANTTINALGISKTTIGSKDESLDSLETIDNAMAMISSSRASFGAMQSRLEHAINHLESHQYSIEEARSKMADTDVAEAISTMTAGQIALQFQVGVLTQANSSSQSALKLLQS